MSPDTAWAARMAVDACATAAELMAADAGPDADRWTLYAQRLRAINAGVVDIVSTAPDAGPGLLRQGVAP